MDKRHGFEFALRVCWYYELHQVHWKLHSPVAEPSRVRLSSQLPLRHLSFSPVCFSPHCVSEMARQRGKSKRGSAWQPSRPRLALHPPPAPSHNSSSSSPSSLSQSSHSLNNLPPLSSPFACRLEWFDLSGNSLGFNPGPLDDLASASQSILVAPPNLPTNSPTQLPPALPHCAQTQRGGYEASHGSQQRPHSYADSASELQAGLALLQGNARLGL